MMQAGAWLLGVKSVVTFVGRLSVCLFVCVHVRRMAWSLCVVIHDPSCSQFLDLSSGTGAGGIGWVIMVIVDGSQRVRLGFALHNQCLKEKSYHWHCLQLMRFERTTTAVVRLPTVGRP